MPTCPSITIPPCLDGLALAPNPEAQKRRKTVPEARQRLLLEVNRPERGNGCRMACFCNSSAAAVNHVTLFTETTFSLVAQFPGLSWEWK